MRGDGNVYTLVFTSHGAVTQGRAFQLREVPSSTNVYTLNA